MIRNAKQLFEEELSGESLTQESVIEAIKMVQLEVIEETVKLCVKNAYAEESRIGYGWEVNEDSILKCAEILKKEIE